MALTYQESRLVRATIPFLKEHGETVSELVYNSLLVKHPELNNSLNVIHVKDGRLARALTVIILKFAGNINNISELIPSLERICQKHCTLGIQPQHYDLLGKVIIDAFEEYMGPELMDAATKAAWTKAYCLLSHMLMGRERHIYKQFEARQWADFRRFRIDRKTAESRAEVDDLYSFYLVPVDGRRLPSFLPGQYVTIRLHVAELGHQQTRQYSLSDAPNGDYYRLTIKRDDGTLYSNQCRNRGMVSNLLIDRYQPGHELDLSHPSGDFVLDWTVPSMVPVVLISAGAGVAPLAAMLNAVAETQPTRRLSWIHGCRHDVPFDSRLRHITRRCPNVSRTIFKTRPGRDDLAGISYDFNCRVDLTKLRPAVLETDHSGAEYFICGPETFMRDMVRQLTAMGVSQSRIKCELYSVGEMRLDTIVCR